MSIYFENLKYRAYSDDPEDDEEDEEDEFDDEDEDEDEEDDEEDPTGGDSQAGEADPLNNAIASLSLTEERAKKITPRFKALSKDLLEFATKSIEIMTNDQILDDMRVSRSDFNRFSDSEWADFKVGLQNYIHRTKSFIGAYKSLSKEQEIHQPQFCCSPKGMDKFKRDGKHVKKIKLNPSGTYTAKPDEVETNPEMCSRTRHFFGDNLPCDKS